MALREDVELVRTLLDDTRATSERGYARGETVQTQLGDVAMATIAMLHDVPLADAGFAGVETHPTYAFILTDIGFSDEDDSLRKAAREKINKLLEDKLDAVDEREPEGS